jgi:23S rRNA (adenine2030-N6)-methyltransferase
MNYGHLYHAGNFADVFKHLVLICLLQSFIRKETPFCYLDTYAGAGIYDLQSFAAQQTQEHQSGIDLVWEHGKLEGLLRDYLGIVERVNKGEELRFYPGSPYIAFTLLRPQDRMVLTEWHPEVLTNLRQVFRGQKQVAIHHQDAYQALKAFLPPTERRGLVLIDPPFEQANEFKQLSIALQEAAQRWSTGVYAVWFPIKDASLVNNFYRQLKDSALPSVLKVEFHCYSHIVPDKLSSCGMIIINAPWQVDQQLDKVLTELLKILALPTSGNYKMEWLKPKA